MKRINSILLFLLLFASLNISYANFNGTSITTGFIRDTYGTSFYCDDINCYNDGWHLIDDNGDGIYEYYYFSLSGHMLKDAIAPNGYQLNQDRKLIIDDILYKVNFIDVVNSNVAIFLNKIEIVEELTKGLETDYNQVFNKWYIKSKAESFMGE